MNGCVWKDIPGWEGKYQASSDGRVRSLDRDVWAYDPVGRFRPRRYRGRELKAGVGKNGYRLVCLVENDQREYRYIHDLVLAAFVGPRPDGTECCHNNGVRADNRLANLRYDTRSANSRDREKHGTVRPPRWEASGMAKLTDEAVRDIRDNYRKGEWSEAARLYDVSPTTVRFAAIYQSWTHLE